jgi:hypothetical protein
MLAEKAAEWLALEAEARLESVLSPSREST